MKKKYFLIYACAAMTFAFSGCGASGDSAQMTEPSPEVAAPESPAPSESASESPTPDNFVAPDIELPQLEPVMEGDQIAIITTDMGEIKIRLFPQYAPKAVENFVTHAKDGYYDGVIFHRVIDNFMIQTGDPEGTGAGGESIYGEDFEDEFTPSLHNIRGALSMANAGSDTNGSQFFIVQNKAVSDRERELFESSKDDMNQVIGQDASGREIRLSEAFPEKILDAYLESGGSSGLDFEHTVFGQVYEGMDVVDAIAAVECEGSENAPRPVEDIHIQKMEISEYK